MDKLQMLREMRASGRFDHATYRDVGTIWEGLMVYEKWADGFRGYRPAILFSKHEPDLLAEAERICRGTGISFGAYGHG